MPCAAAPASRLASSGLWRTMSSIPGSCGLNIVLVICTIVALPASINISLISGATDALDLYFSCSSANTSSYSGRFSCTPSPQPSSFKSNGSNLEFKNSSPVTAAISILPWNAILCFFSHSALMSSYSAFISSSEDFISYFLDTLIPGFLSNASKYRIYLNFSASI